MRTTLYEDIILPVIPIKNFTFIQIFFRQCYCFYRNGPTKKYYFWITILLLKIFNLYILSFYEPKENDELTQLLVLDYFRLMKLPQNFTYLSINIMIQFFLYYRLMMNRWVYQNGIIQYPYQVLINKNMKSFLKSVDNDRKLIYFNVQRFTLYTLNILQSFIFVTGNLLFSFCEK